MEENDRYQSFVTQFATAFNAVLKESTKDLSDAGISVNKTQLLGDLFGKINEQVKAADKEDEQPVYTIFPSEDLSMIPETAKRNVINFMKDSQPMSPPHIVEILGITKTEKFYDVSFRTIESHYITRSFTEEELLALLNKPEEKKEEIMPVFEKKKKYNMTII